MAGSGFNQGGLGLCRGFGFRHGENGLFGRYTGILGGHYGRYRGERVLQGNDSHMSYSLNSLKGVM